MTPHLVIHLDKSHITARQENPERRITIKEDSTPLGADGDQIPTPRMLTPPVCHAQAVAEPGFHQASAILME